MRQKSRWKGHWYIVFMFPVVFCSPSDGNIVNSRNAQKSLFSPRMDYNQWKPLGRGDPLKNDPTFDYVPPVLDHVHYWMDSEPPPQVNSNGETGQKTEILLLGVSSKKPAINSGQKHPSVTAEDRRDTVYDSYSKYYQEKNSNYHNHHSNQRIARPNYFSSMTSQIIPSIMSFANKVFDRTTYSKEQTSGVPYTVLMPPPIVTNDPTNINQYSNSMLTTLNTQKPFTASQSVPTKTQYFTSSIPPKRLNGVTVEESNLIYQSSSLGGHKEFESVPSISWELSTTTEPNKNNFVYNQQLSPPKSFTRVQFAPHNFTNKILEASDSNHHINFVTPPPLKEDRVMFKGIVSDDNEISNSYVKIEKPEAQMDHMDIDNNNIHPMSMFSHTEPLRTSNQIPPISMQTIRDMETMKPPPVTESPIYTRPTTPASFTQTSHYQNSFTENPIKPFLTTASPAPFSSTNPVLNVLKKEQIISDFESSNFIGSSSSLTHTFVTTSRDDSSLPVSTLPTILSDSNTVLSELSVITTSPPSSPVTTTESITTMQTLTTDPLFKHYRQPMEPMRGPLYLIIQGHSKVKTYKPAKQIDGIMVQETNEIPYLKDRKIDYSIKHLHGFENNEDFLTKSENIARQRQARTGNLMTLKHVVQTGLGAVDFNRVDQHLLRRSDVDKQETELEVGYEIVDSKDITSEKYRKGIVEEARKFKKLEN